MSGHEASYHQRLLSRIAFTIPQQFIRARPRSRLARRVKGYSDVAGMLKYLRGIRQMVTTLHVDRLSTRVFTTVLEHQMGLRTAYPDTINSRPALSLNPDFKHPNQRHASRAVVRMVRAYHYLLDIRPLRRRGWYSPGGSTQAQSPLIKFQFISSSD